MAPRGAAVGGADSWPVARLRAPRLGVDLIVLANATGSTLAFAPGHVDGTAAPGAPGNTVLAGHRDTHFAFLERLRPGDELRLERPGGPEARYAVRSARIVDRARTEILAPAERDLLTLVTCWPFAAVSPGGRERYVVQARADLERLHRASRNFLALLRVRSFSRGRTRRRKRS